MEDKKVWKKWWFWVIVAVIIFVLPFAETDNKVENNEIKQEENNIDSSVVQTEEDELKSELFGDSDDKTNYFFNNEKTIRKFVLAYNENANIKITNVDWVNSHSIADVKFDNMSARLNSGTDNGFLIEFEFTNGEKMINQYKEVIKDLIFVFDSNVQEDTFNEAFNNAQTNQHNPINVTDNISIKMHYSKEQVGYKSGDRYYIDITCSNYNK